MAQRLGVDHRTLGAGSARDDDFPVHLNVLRHGRAEGVTRLTDLGAKVLVKADGKPCAGRQFDHRRRGRRWRLSLRGGLAGGRGLAARRGLTAGRFSGWRRWLRRLGLRGLRGRTASGLGLGSRVACTQRKDRAGKGQRRERRKPMIEAHICLLLRN